LSTPIRTHTQTHTTHTHKHARTHTHTNTSMSVSIVKLWQCSSGYCDRDKLDDRLDGCMRQEMTGSMHTTGDGRLSKLRQERQARCFHLLSHPSAVACCLQCAVSCVMCAMVCAESSVPPRACLPSHHLILALKSATSRPLCFGFRFNNMFFSG
jgi:hypothetical protein